MSSSSGQSGKSSSQNPKPKPPPSSDWNNLLRHSSPIGIVKPDIITNIYKTSSSTMSDTTTSLPLSSSPTPATGGPDHSPQGIVLHHPRLVRTAHNADGLSVFVADETVNAFQPFGPQASGFYNFDSRTSIPVTNTDPAEVTRDAISRAPPNGVAMGVTDITPSSVVPMHRTQSLDYAVVLSGEIVCELDSGEEKTVRTGEFIIQQGTNHRWRNDTKDVCRMMFVLVGAEKIV